MCVFELDFISEWQIIENKKNPKNNFEWEIENKQKKSNMKNVSLFCRIGDHYSYSVFTFDFESLKFVLNKVAGTAAIDNTHEA